MKTVWTAVALTTVLGLGACASTPESRLRNDVFLDIYWTASRECEARYRTLHVDHIAMDGSLSLIADANSRSEARPFRECYWKTIRDRAERRRAAGLPMPDDANLQPDIDID
jgi:hypothetical protein